METHARNPDSTSDFPDSVRSSEVPESFKRILDQERFQARAIKKNAEIDAEISKIPTGLFSRSSDAKKIADLNDEKTLLHLENFDDNIKGAEATYKKAIKDIHDDRNKLIQLHTETKQLISQLREMSNQDYQNSLNKETDDYLFTQAEDGKLLDMRNTTLANQEAFLKKFAPQDNRVVVTTDMPED
jgi:hypothetical protein